ncbi:hypothetical protein [Janthinobacterium sp.]|uniref:hypothetical protein n=1 Tax=Janthinobacterium sp. TaxID=1871054 RepID=UPI00293D82EE|nr:hypothetical protein [Janthinobacterium sp.]
MSNTPESLATLGALFNSVIAAHGLKNDAGLARALKVAPPVISKQRHGQLSIGATMVLNIHMTFHIPVADILAVTREPASTHCQSGDAVRMAEK